MFSTLAFGLIALSGAFLLAEFDPAKWAQFLILLILGASAVLTVAINEFRKLRALIRNVPNQVSKAIDDSALPTTPEQIRASDDRIATAVVKKQDEAGQNP